MIDKKNLYHNYFLSHYKYDLSNRTNMAKEVDKSYNWYFSLFKYLKIAEQDKKKAILEIGSSIGGWYKLLKENGFQDYMGLEVDEKAVEFSRAIFPEIRVNNIYIEDYESEKKFGLVFALAVLEHLADPIKGLSHIYNVTAEDGQFYAIVPTSDRRSVWTDPTHLFCLHPENWKKLFQLSGFTDFSYRYIFYPLPGIWRKYKKMNIMLPFKLPFNFLNFTTAIMLRCKKVA